MFPSRKLCSFTFHIWVCEVTQVHLCVWCKVGVKVHVEIQFPQPHLLKRALSEWHRCPCVRGCVFWLLHTVPLVRVSVCGHVCFTVSREISGQPGPRQLLHSSLAGGRAGRPDCPSWPTRLPHLSKRCSVGIGSLLGSQGFPKEVRLTSATTLRPSLRWGLGAAAWESGAELG